MRMSALFGAKKFGILKIHVVSARTRRGVEPVQTFGGQEGSIFRDFVRTSFMDGPLHGYLAYTSFKLFNLLNFELYLEE